MFVAKQVGEFFTCLGHANDNIAMNTVCIKAMHRLRHIITDIVRCVHRCIFWIYTNSTQTRCDFIAAGRHIYSMNFSQFICTTFIGFNLNTTRIPGNLEIGIIWRDKFTCARRTKITCNAAHRQIVGSVWCNPRIKHNRTINNSAADFGIFGQFDNTTVVIIYPQFTTAAHHTIRHNATQFSALDFVSFDNTTRPCQRRNHTNTHIWCTTNDLAQFTSAIIYTQHMQMVTVFMGLAFNYFCRNRGQGGD